MSDLMQQIEEIERRARELEERLADTDVAGVPGEYARVVKQFADIRQQAEVGRGYRETVRQIEETRSMLSDPDAEIGELARTELERLTQSQG